MASRAALGRGLSALIPEISLDDQERVDSIQEIEVARVMPNPFQPRETFDPVALDELKNSIAEKGVIQPITVRRIDSNFQLIAGERRLRAVQALGFETIPAYILQVQSEEELLELSLIENIQREDLNPIDVARGYQRLMTECQLTQEEVAKKVGKDRTTITNFIRLLKLPDEIQDSLKRGELSMGHARALITLQDKDFQLRLWKKILKENLSVRKVEAIVKDGNQSKSKRQEKREEPVSLFIKSAEDKLRTIFGTQVHIRMKDSKGKIEVEFYSEEELERLLGLMERI